MSTEKEGLNILNMFFLYKTNPAQIVIVHLKNKNKKERERERGREGKKILESNNLKRNGKQKFCWFYHWDNDRKRRTGRSIRKKK